MSDRWEQRASLRSWGGFEFSIVAPTMFVTASQVGSNGEEWEATFLNAAASNNATVSVVCAYFKTR
ncbi:MAG: hypothetical protein U0Z70_02480 [Thermomicrobiales bacterium]